MKNELPLEQCMKKNEKHTHSFSFFSDFLHTHTHSLFLSFLDFLHTHSFSSDTHAHTLFCLFSPSKYSSLFYFLPFLPLNTCNAHHTHTLLFRSWRRQNYIGSRFNMPNLDTRNWNLFSSSTLVNKSAS
ncbi:unnamed protein product [Cuscuta epithymum]|uniref:Uncharacterized protein n=1 Tax=Cuscuta epithymum TaxID=186058 RepID=A0AAV0GKC7_9ASTE|nr:unnamed protein product [Cuscuta epithymum]